MELEVKNHNLANDHLEFMIESLQEADVDITGVYMATPATDPGVEIENKYILQWASYHNPRYILDKVESIGEEIFSSDSLNAIIQFIRKK